jgi:hypothetical protein
MNDLNLRSGQLQIPPHIVKEMDEMRVRVALDKKFAGTKDFQIWAIDVSRYTKNSQYTDHIAHIKARWVEERNK